MKVLITKDAASKVPREVVDLTAARAIAAIGFHVELLDDEGNTSPLPEDEVVADDAPPADDAHVAVGSTRFSDGELQTDASLAQAQAAPAPEAKRAPAKNTPAKAAKKR